MAHTIVAHIRRDHLADAILILEMVHATASSIPTLSGLSVITLTVLNIVKMMAHIKSDKERCLRFAHRAASLVKHVQETIDVDAEATDERLEANLAAMQEALDGMHVDIEQFLGRSTWFRLLHHAGVSKMIDRHIETLDSAWRKFDTACLIALQQKVERQARQLHEQATYDVHQVRLFRESDIKRRKVRTRIVRRAHQMVGDWEGEWEGRDVLVRASLEEQTWESDLPTFHRSLPKIMHPSIGQLLGYSHPSIPEKFYVLETGPVSVVDYLRDQDTATRVKMWLKLLVEFEDTLEYVNRLRRTTRNPWVHRAHCSQACLPANMLKTDGTLLFTMEDLWGASPQCMYFSCRKAYSGICPSIVCGKETRRGPLPLGGHLHFGRVDEWRAGIVTNSPRVVLASPRREVHQPAPITLCSSDLTGWGPCNHIFVSASLGDYGYIDFRQPARFIRIGNVFERTGIKGDTGGPQMQMRWKASYRPSDWPLEPKRYRFGKHLSERLEITQLGGWDYLHFFWDEVMNDAKCHRVALHDLVFVDAVYYHAHATAICPSPARRSTQSPYFFQIPLNNDGTVPSPWGYWSLDPQAIPGPRPIIDVPGVRLECDIRFQLSRLTSLDIEMLTHIREMKKQGARCSIYGHPVLLHLPSAVWVHVVIWCIVFSAHLAIIYLLSPSPVKGCPRHACHSECSSECGLQL
ncbi:hypothetical protein OBBRIDRAFT_36172 [Obba rivulosa]|uniref:Mixed lineage kinase domain-containing protein n=1 Tax=Obba rivulosa TaxID=1052685 RepID=A0A8E2DJB6_9APHY|nr:hypothetical protein OBBRIDRAFT_36172 [Obba rivulosa]